MERTPKKILGFLGLALVAAMTIFAAVLPSPEVLAVSTVTDSIMVTVKPPAYVADVNWLDHKDDVPYVYPNQNIKYNINGVERVTIALDYTDVNNNTSSYIIYDQAVGPQLSTETLVLDLANYGYGKFRLSLEGGGQYGSDRDYIAFSYVPVTAEVVEDKNDGKIYSILNYDNASPDLGHFIIDIYDDQGNPIPALSGIRVDKPETKVELKFAENGLNEGTYKVLTRAMDTSGQLIYKSWENVYFYQPVMAVPNTGGLFTGLNISKIDYLVTGLIVFALTGGFGIWFVSKKGSKRR